MFGLNFSEIMIFAVVLAFPLLLHKGIRLQIAHSVKKEIRNNGGQELP